MTTPTTDPVQTDFEGEEMREKIEAIIRKHVYCDATGLSPHIASVFLHGFDKAAEEITALRSTPEGGDQGAEAMRERVDGALNEACRMSAILLMAGEMTAQERRTACAVANGIAAKVRAVLSPQPQSYTEEAGEL